MPRKLFGRSDNNGPMPVKTRAWMNDILLDGREGPNEFILYYSSHNSGGSESSIDVLGTPSVVEGPWRPIQPLNNRSVIQLPSNTSCSSLHSPSIVVDDEERSMFMYIHGHGCKGVSAQPTLVFRSTDGVKWTRTTDGLYLFRDLFYLTPLTSRRHEDGYFYAAAKTQESPEGSAILCRSTSMAGPFERGPILGRGLRHLHVHLVQDRHLFIFFTLIGDAPERILLGTVDMMTDDDDWMKWKLLPGPTILEPRFDYERGNARTTPSAAGGANGPRVELRDPRFIADDDTDGLSGLLFYTVQGEQALASAYLSINVTDYLTAVRYRDQHNVEASVLNSTSIRSKSGVPSPRRNTTLITGTGRSGTTYVCKLFSKSGLGISHDNDVDCGVYPGADGAASWYDAFDVGRKYDTVLHIVRYPLHVINSRVLRIVKTPYNALHTASFCDKYEDMSDMLQWYSSSAEDRQVELLFRSTLKHWVRRNSFVQRHAEWRETIDDLSSEAMVAWRMCMASYLGPRCPSLLQWNKAVDAIDKTINTSGNLTADINVTSSKGLRWSWDDLTKLGQAESDYVAIAKQMAFQYGYDENGTKVANVLDLPNPGYTYDCGFARGKLPSHWNCWLVANDVA